MANDEYPVDGSIDKPRMNAFEKEIEEEVKVRTESDPLLPQK